MAAPQVQLRTWTNNRIHVRSVRGVAIGPIRLPASSPGFESRFRNQSQGDRTYFLDSCARIADKPPNRRFGLPGPPSVQQADAGIGKRTNPTPGATSWGFRKFGFSLESSPSRGIPPFDAFWAADDKLREAACPGALGRSVWEGAMDIHHSGTASPYPRVDSPLPSLKRVQDLLTFFWSGFEGNQIMPGFPGHRRS